MSESKTIAAVRGLAPGDVVILSPYDGPDVRLIADSGGCVTFRADDFRAGYSLTFPIGATPKLEFMAAGGGVASEVSAAGPGGLVCWLRS